MRRPADQSVEVAVPDAHQRNASELSTIDEALEFVIHEIEALRETLHERHARLLHGSLDAIASSFYGRCQRLFDQDVPPLGGGALGKLDVIEGFRGDRDRVAGVQVGVEVEQRVEQRTIPSIRPNVRDPLGL